MPQAKTAANTTNTVRLHRVLTAKPEKVYRAFLDADAMAKWLPPRGFTAKIHHMEAKVGGTFKMSFTNFATGKRHSFGGKYLELGLPAIIPLEACYLGWQQSLRQL